MAQLKYEDLNSHDLLLTTNKRVVNKIKCPATNSKYQLKEKLVSESVSINNSSKNNVPLIEP